jgi:hypothetical protein
MKEIERLRERVAELEKAIEEAIQHLGCESGVSYIASGLIAVVDAAREVDTDAD